jgi:hypothetical protein
VTKVIITPAFVSECCSTRTAIIMMSGVGLIRNFGGLKGIGTGATGTGTGAIGSGTGKTGNRGRAFAPSLLRLIAAVGGAPARPSV